MALEEAHLVERARAGDVEAFEALMARHAGRVRARAYRITRNEADTEEVVQDGFVSLFRKLGAFEGRAGLGTWPWQVATHAALDRLRGERAPQPGDTVPAPCGDPPSLGSTTARTPTDDPRGFRRVQLDALAKLLLEKEVVDQTGRAPGKPEDLRTVASRRFPRRGEDHIALA
jgi:RNA polymerase sigma factor (sigma-70 family)